MGRMRPRDGFNRLDLCQADCVRAASLAAQRVKGLVWREAATQSPVERSRTQAPLHLEIRPSGIWGKRSVYPRFRSGF
jgi:hypothetical protein